MAQRGERTRRAARPAYNLANDSKLARVLELDTLKPRDVMAVAAAPASR